MAAGDDRLIVSRSRLGVLGLIGPGALWLALFFFVPMVFMGVVSLESGSIDEGFVFNWSFGNYADAISSIPDAVPALVRLWRRRQPLSRC